MLPAVPPPENALPGMYITPTMTIAHLSLIILSLFMLHEFDEIILVRPWI